MRCAICDADSDTVTLVSDCAVCQEAIQDCLDGYPRLDEDEVDNVDPEYDEEATEWLELGLAWEAARDS